MKKKISSIILVIFMLTAIFPTTVSAAGIFVTEIASGLEYYDIGSFSEGFAQVWKNDKTGYINKSGELVIPCMYEYAYTFSNGVARAKIDDKESYIDKYGKNIITFEYDEVGDFSDGMAWIKKGGKYGYIDTSGDLVIPMIYDAYTDDFEGVNNLALDFSEGLAALRIDGKCGFINKKGELVIPAIYDGNFWHGEWWNYLPKFHDGIVRLRKDDYSGCIDKTGKVVIPFEYYWLGNGWTGFFNAGLGIIDKYFEDNNRKCGLIDKNGNFVVPLGQYDGISDFNGALAFVMDYDIGGEYGAYIDKTGKLVTDFEYYADQWCNWYYMPSSEDMTIAQKGGKFGFLDNKGNEAVPFEYDMVEPFSDGLAYVWDRENEKSGYVDKTGKLIIQNNDYNMAHSFSDGLAWVQKDDKYGYIDSTGELVVPLIYDYAYDFNEGLAAVRKDGKWSILAIENYTPKTGDSSVIPLCFVCMIIFVLVSVKIHALCSSKTREIL